MRGIVAAGEDMGPSASQADRLENAVREPADAGGSAQAGEPAVTRRPITWEVVEIGRSSQTWARGPAVRASGQTGHPPVETPRVRVRPFSADVEISCAVSA